MVFKFNHLIKHSLPSVMKNNKKQQKTTKNNKKQQKTAIITNIKLNTH